MLLTLSTTMPQADDLGYLLHKHPARAQSVDTSAGTAHVFWPEASAGRASAALLLEVDPIALVRGKHPRDTGALAQYVNDRPYAASSMLAVALSRVFRTAMTRRCDSRPELVERPLPLEVDVPALPSRGGPELIERLFAPLGWAVEARALPLDETLPHWGDSRYCAVRLTGDVVLADALSHLYVLLPVLDDSKHYWVGPEEVDKLLRAAGGWLPAHPERELITRRYLAHDRSLVQSAVGRLAEVDDTAPEALDNAVPDGRAVDDAQPRARQGAASDEQAVDDARPDVLKAAPDEAAVNGNAPEAMTNTPLEPAGADQAPTPLSVLRKLAVVEALKATGTRTVVDLGCGEGALLRELIRDPAFTKVVGADVSTRALTMAARRLHLDRMPDSQRARLELLQTSATYRDDRLAGYDAVVLMEVIEHLDLPRLPALVASVFGSARPTTVVVTTPNVEHNVRYPFLAAGAVRHGDHRFEWTRAELRTWAGEVAEAHGYDVRFEPVGDDDPEVGPPTQLALFTRAA